MEVLVTVSGLDTISRHFDRLEQNLASEQAMAEIGKTIKEYNEKNWGRGVKDVETTTERWPDHQNLVNTGRLKDSMRIKQVTPTSVTYGTDDYVARFLQYGTRKMLKKRVIRLPRKRIKLILRELLLKGTGAGGL